MDENSRELLFISVNKEKLEYMKQNLKQYGIAVTCVENKLCEFVTDELFFITAGKATEAYQKLGKPCVVLDTGFYIDNYPNYKGFPGALINRGLSQIGGVDGLLFEMRNIKERTCHFKECLVYYDGDDLQTFYGHSYGTLALEKRGNCSSSWTKLWNVFIPAHCNKTLAEMTKEERLSNTDFYTDATKQFASWYKKSKVKVLK